jgi:hypothetical protein
MLLLQKKINGETFFGAKNKIVGFKETNYLFFR